MLFALNLPPAVMLKYQKLKEAAVAEAPADEATASLNLVAARMNRIYEKIAKVYYNCSGLIEQPAQSPLARNSATALASITAVDSQIQSLLDKLSLVCSKKPRRNKENLSKKKY